MRYFGSKTTAAPALFARVHERVSNGTFCDPFGGIGVVGAYFKERGYAVATSDVLRFAHYFQIARILNNSVPTFSTLREALGLTTTEELVRHIQRMEQEDGWLVENYSRTRMFFTEVNASRIQACWRLFRDWANAGLIREDERAVLLASLINSADRVANTAGTYYAHLKSWHRKALLPFRFELLPPVTGRGTCRCVLADARYLVSQGHWDVLYLDPPYNERSYPSYYHFPETLASLEETTVHGASGIPVTTQPSSLFNRPRKALTALTELLDGASFGLLAFHYADNGLISPDDLMELFQSIGTVDVVHLSSRGYTTNSPTRSVQHTLYLVCRA